MSFIEKDIIRDMIRDAGGCARTVMVSGEAQPCSRRRACFPIREVRYWYPEGFRLGGKVLFAVNPPGKAAVSGLRRLVGLIPLFPAALLFLVEGRSMIPEGMEN
jgi:hypothetical protein